MKKAAIIVEGSLLARYPDIDFFRFSQHFKTHLKKSVFVFTLFSFFFFAGCDPSIFDRPGREDIPANHTRKYPADVAVQWVNLQQHLIKTSPGFDPLVASRSFGYSGLTL